MYTYLASPYSGTEQEQDHRCALVEMAAVKLFDKGIAIFSPIAHCHNMAKTHRLPGTFDFWQWYNKIMITQSNCFAILNVQGWSRSTGVWNEFNIAKGIGKPIVFYTFIGDDIEQVSEADTCELVARLYGVHTG